MSMTRFSREKWPWLLLLPLLLVLLAWAIYRFAGLTFVYFEAATSHSAVYKVYWVGKSDSKFTEQRATTVYVNNRKRHHIVVLDVPLHQLRKIRLDPSGKRGVRTEIRKVNLYGLGSQHLRFQGKALKAFIPGNDVGEFKVNKNQLSLISTGGDAQIAAPIHAEYYLGKRSFVARLLGFGVLLIIGVYLGRRLLEDNLYVPLGLAVAVVSAASMATVSKSQSHPDEYIHIKNAEYYQQQYLPPEVCSEAAMSTYSDYGISRLNNREIAYYAGGRMLELFDGIPADNYLKLRFFNVVLFAILMVLALTASSARWLFMPLLLTPQAWYLFSYYNSDAFSFFVIYFAAYQLFYQNSLLRRSLRYEVASWWLALLGLGALFALQFLVKLNYLFFAFMLVMWLGAYLLFEHRMPSWLASRRSWLMLGLGVLLFSVWEVSRHAVNDFELTQAVEDCRYQTATPLYHPDTPLEKLHPNMYLKDKGVGYFEMIERFNWYKRILFTALGTYGHTEYLNTNTHFVAMATLIVLLALYVFAQAARQPGAWPKVQVLTTVLAGFALLVAAAYMNWTGDYQPQGRYLMPWLVMLGSLMMVYRSALHQNLIAVLLVPAFSLSLYSFYAVALAEVPFWR